MKMQPMSTGQTIKQYKAIRAEIRAIEADVARLEQLAGNMEASRARQTIEATARQNRERVRELSAHIQQADRIIKAMPDKETKRAVKAHYIQGRPWAAVGPDRIRKHVKRQIKKLDNREI